MLCALCEAVLNMLSRAQGNNKIKMVNWTAPYAVSAFLGDGTIGLSRNQFNIPLGLAFNPAGDLLFVADAVSELCRALLKLAALSLGKSCRSSALCW